MHGDIVYGLPPDAEQLAKTDVCENQGMYIKGRIITVQGHPEFTREIEDEIIKSRFKQGIFTEELYKDAMRRLKDHDDGIVVAQAFLRFLLED
jgi:GMP synthase-like glutamine amidotransferase